MHSLFTAAAVNKMQASIIQVQNSGNILKSDAKKKTALDTPITSSVVAEPQRYFNMKGRKIRFNGRLILSFGFFYRNRQYALNLESWLQVYVQKKK